jgi:hypothetical protein
MLSKLSNYRVACRTAETVLGKFLKAKAGILANGKRAAGYELSGKSHVLQQSTFRALKQLAIIRENAQRSSLFL